MNEDQMDLGRFEMGQLMPHLEEQYIQPSEDMEQGDE